MTNQSLARSYLIKAEKRLKALAVLKAEAAHSDVVREAQELVELALKGVLRAIFIPTEEYTAEDAYRAYRDAEWIVGLGQRVIRGLSP